jgi:hypothetical protein
MKGRAPWAVRVGIKLGAFAHELRLNHVECAFNRYEPDVDRIDDAIASEEKG